MATKKLADRLRMRTTLLVPLLAAFFAWTMGSLLLVRVIVQQETRKALLEDLRLSGIAYRHVQEHHREMVSHAAALMAQLPTIKALMSSNDPETIRDAGAEFWRSSGSDLFVFLGSDGSVAAAFRREGAFSTSTLEEEIQGHLKAGDSSFYLTISGTLYEVAMRPLNFGPASEESVLGYIAIGFSVNDATAREVSEETAAQVAFLLHGRVLAGTMSSQARTQLETSLREKTPGEEGSPVKVGNERFLGMSIPLVHEGGAPGDGPVLVVLKSFAQEQRLLRRVNRWILGLSVAAFAAASLILLGISQSVTRPLVALMEGVRALGRGDYSFRLPDEGAEEVRELSHAFGNMREQLQSSQRDLLQAERLATIGRMASSISHDLRHHLSAMYANAEFLIAENTPQAEREELFEEIRTAVLGMTDMLDSLLLFTQTGRSLRCNPESLALLLQRSVGMLRAHPAARDVSLSVDGLSSVRANVDGLKLGRAVYNLLLNGCEAARKGPKPPQVKLTLAEDESYLRIHVADSGEGILESVQRTLFQPFVSAGKPSGTGLGLTLADQVATEHGGYIYTTRTDDGWTLFTIVLPKDAREDDVEPAESAAMGIA
jgi:signal transduction histidine kinase